MRSDSTAALSAAVFDLLSSGVQSVSFYRDANGNGVLDSTDPLLVTDADGLLKTGPGTLLLTAVNTYLGESAIGGGVLQIGIDHALPTTGVVRIGDRNIGSGVLDLNGHNQTLAGLYTDNDGVTGGLGNGDRK